MSLVPCGHMHCACDRMTPLLELLLGSSPVDMARTRGKGRGHRRVEGPRSGTAGVQPELSGPRPGQYWQRSEAVRYHSREVAQLQAELTQSAYALGKLSSSQSSVILDVGAGGGLSSVSLQALAAAESGRQPPFVLAIDASFDMLRQSPTEADLAGVRVPAPRCVEDSDMIDIADGLQWRSSRSDAVLADFSQPLPFRSDVADAVISISAIQWLFDVRSAAAVQCEGGVEEAAEQPRIEALFDSLQRVCVRDAPIAL
eukprot:5286342-Amphidinium_carterae.1